MVKVIVRHPDGLGPSWRLGAEVDVSLERAARWASAGLVAIPEATAPPVQPPPANDPPAPPALPDPPQPPAPPAPEAPAKPKGGRRKR